MFPSVTACWDCTGGGVETLGFSETGWRNEPRVTHHTTHSTSKTRIGCDSSHRSSLKPRKEIYNGTRRCSKQLRRLRTAEPRCRLRWSHKWSFQNRLASAFAADNIMVRLRLLAVRKYGNFVFVSDNILGLYRREDARRLARVYLAIVF